MSEKRLGNKTLAALYLLSGIFALIAGIVGVFMLFDLYIPSETGQLIVWSMIAGIVLVQFLIMCFEVRPPKD